MQPVLQGYMGLLQGEKLHLYSLKTIEKLRTDDGAWLYYKLTYEPSAQVS